MFPCSDISTSTVIKCLTTLFSLFGTPAFVHSDRGASFMSHELQAFLREKVVATSRTTSYNPAGNGQVERYNGIIWKAVEMSLKPKNLHTKYWQVVLPDVLHSIRSLLCTATNETPHERFFTFPRRSSSGASIPTWMAEPGAVLLKRHVRPTKADPLVDEVELLQANPHYAFGDMSRNAHNNKNGKNGKISPTTTWRPMQMRRQEGPLVKPAILANLAKNGKLVKIADNNLEGNASEKTRGPPCKAGEFGEFGETGKNGKLVKIADNNLEANANEKTRGPPCKAGEFGESGKNGKLVKIANNNLEVNANERARGTP